jgi:hypothetical protein
MAGSGNLVYQFGSSYLPLRLSTRTFGFNLVIGSMTEFEFLALAAFKICITRGILGVEITYALGPTGDESKVQSACRISAEYEIQEKPDMLLEIFAYAFVACFRSFRDA